MLEPALVGTRKDECLFFFCRPSCLKDHTPGQARPQASAHPPPFRGRPVTSPTGSQPGKEDSWELEANLRMQANGSSKLGTAPSTFLFLFPFFLLEAHPRRTGHRQRKTWSCAPHLPCCLFVFVVFAFHFFLLLFFHCFSIFIFSVFVSFLSHLEIRA